MPDVHDKATRSRNMAAIRGSDTKPELLIRGGLHRLGFRYRLHARDLPGRPDLVFAKFRAVLFVHGCFWHGHDCALGARVPKANRDYWLAKVARNVARDARAQAALVDAGWRVETVWECDFKDEAALTARLQALLDRASGLSRLASSRAVST
ncbi:MAG: DNA mismatch endonuclease Vsr [Caulobacter sp.]|nr:DNA mismatch endonuclease Vsr [Caulobacter sp.]